MRPGRRSLLLCVIVCCGSFLTLGATSRADTLTGTVGSSPIYSSIPVIAGDNLQVIVTSANLGNGQSTRRYYSTGKASKSLSRVETGAADLP
jgi:hypothetical protein